jgi:hypothetical protein
MVFTSWLRNLKSNLRRKTVALIRKGRFRGRKWSVTPLLEFLEDRTVPTGMNSAPAVSEITLPTTSVAVNSPFTFSATFVDLDASDTHTAECIWSDSSRSPGTVNENNGAGTVTGSHTFTTAGIHQFALYVTDSEGASDSRLSGIFFVYDPNGAPATPSISGRTGKLVQNIELGTFNHARAIAEDPVTGNIVALTDVGGLRINRFLPNGSPDLSFGEGNGGLGFDFAITPSQYGLAVDSFGRILIAGSVDNGATGMDFAVARYDSDGVLDISVIVHVILGKSCAAAEGADW